MTTVLEVQSLTKGFTMHHLGNHLAAFDQISFDLKAGEFLLLKGQNGAGKSTLLRTLYRSYVAQSGKVIFQIQTKPWMGSKPRHPQSTMSQTAMVSTILSAMFGSGPKTAGIPVIKGRQEVAVPGKQVTVAVP